MTESYILSVPTIYESLCSFSEKTLIFLLNNRWRIKFGEVLRKVYQTFIASEIKCKVSNNFSILKIAYQPEICEPAVWLAIIKAIVLQFQTFNWATVWIRGKTRPQICHLSRFSIFKLYTCDFVALLFWCHFSNCSCPKDNALDMFEQTCFYQNY